MYNDYNEIPCSIKELGYSLSDLGINEYAWRKNEILKIIQIFREKGIPVLGGDVYELHDRRIQATCDSWYTEDEEKKDYIERSLEKTRLYIEEYENLNGNHFIYSIVY